MIKHRNALNNLKPYVPGKPIDDVKSEFGISEIIKLASNENPLGCSKKAVEQMHDCFGMINLYPDGNCSALRKKLASHLGVDMNSLLFGCGTDEVISMLAQAYINPGDEVITAEITFSQYAAAVCACDVVMVYTPMLNHGYDLDAIINAITEKTRMIFIANPNNPTGTVFLNDAQKSFLERVPSNILVVLDEAYFEYVDNVDYPNSISYLPQYENLIVMRTFSKIYGLASLRVGFGVMHPSLVLEIDKIRKPFNVSMLAQKAAIAALDDKDFLVLSFLSNQFAKEFTVKKLDELGLSYIPTNGNFIMIRTNKNSNELFNSLMKRGVIVRAGSAFDMGDYIRVTLGTVEQMKTFFEALEKEL